MIRLAVLAAGAALAASAALAQAPNPPPGGPERGRETSREERGRRPFNRAEMDALVDARVAAMQAGLKLTPDQQRYWPAVEQAIRDMAAARISRMERWRESRSDDRRQADRPDFLETLERGSQRVDEHAERLKALASAMRPLWTSLDDRQRHLLPVLIRPTGDAGRRRGWREGRRGGHHGHHNRGGPDGEPGRR